MTTIWIGCMVVGFVLGVWAIRSLPPGTDLAPVPIQTRTTTGPYRWLAHPMYVGNGLFIVGAAGLAAGIWNSLAAACVAELVMREWAQRETRPSQGEHP